MTLTKKYDIISYSGGTMGTASYPYVCGKSFEYSLDGFKINKRVFKNKKIDFIITGNNIEDYDFLQLDTLDLDLVNKINEEKRIENLNVILKSDLTRVIRIMTENKKGFEYLMDKETETSKSLSFLNVLKDYYRDNFYFPEDTNAIIKIMIKYGYNFKSMKEATNLIYK